MGRPCRLLQMTHKVVIRLDLESMEALRNVELGTVKADSLELCRMKGDSETGG